jgi:hypothetical protein
MTAPLPLRFHNPVKTMCEKFNLDYETVIGKGLSLNRDAFICSEVKHHLDDFDAETRKALKHKREYFNRKYGSPNAPDTEGGTIEDKGLSRYSEGLLVSPVRSDDSAVDKPNDVSGNVVSVKPRTIRDIPFAGGKRWIPGRPN